MSTDFYLDCYMEEVKQLREENATLSRDLHEARTDVRDLLRLREENAKLQAECAAMRGALQGSRRWVDANVIATFGFPDGANRVALASDAGAKMLAYVDVLEVAASLALVVISGVMTKPGDRDKFFRSMDSALALRRELGRD